MVNNFRTFVERNSRKNKEQLIQSNGQVIIITPKTAHEGKSIMGCINQPSTVEVTSYNLGVYQLADTNQ